MKKNNFFRKIVKENQKMITLLFSILLVFILVLGSSVSSFSILYDEKENISPESAPKIRIDYESKSFIPPEFDLSHLTGQIIPKKYHSLSPPSSYDWRTKEIITSVKDQEDCGSCYAFASIRCFESITRVKMN